MDKYKLSKKELTEGAKLVKHYKKRYVAVNKKGRVIALSLLSALAVGGGSAAGYFGYKAINGGGGSTPVTPVEDKVTIIFKSIDGNLIEKRIEKGKTFKESGVAIPDNTYTHFEWGYKKGDSFIPITDETKFENTLILEEKSSISYSFNFDDVMEVVENGTTDITAKISGKGFVLTDFEIILDYTGGGAEFVGEAVYDYDKNTITRKLKISSSSEECSVKVQIIDEPSKKYVGANSQKISPTIIGVAEKSITLEIGDTKWDFDKIKLQPKTVVLSNKLSENNGNSSFTLEYDNDDKEIDISLKIKNKDDEEFKVEVVRFEAGSGKVLTASLSSWSGLEDKGTYYISGIEFKTVDINYSKVEDYLLENGVVLDTSESTTEINTDNNEIYLSYTYDEELDPVELNLGLYNEKDELIELFSDTSFYSYTLLYFTQFDKLGSGKTLLYLKQAPEEQKWAINYDNDGLSAYGVRFYTEYCSENISESEPEISLSYRNNNKLQDIELGLYTSEDDTTPIQKFTVNFEVTNIGFVDLDEFDKFSEVKEFETLFLKPTKVLKGWTINYNSTGLSQYGITIFEEGYSTETISEENTGITLNYSNTKTARNLTLGLYTSEDGATPVQTFDVSFEAVSDEYIKLDAFTEFSQIESYDTLYLKVVEE